MGELSGPALLGPPRLIEIDGGPKWWVSFHDPPPDYDGVKQAKELTRILLVFNCGRAEITMKEPIPRLVPIPWESEGHYRFVGRIKEVIESEILEMNNPKTRAEGDPTDSVNYGVVIDAEIPLWCHFWVDRGVRIKTGSTIDVSGVLTGGPS